MAKRRRTPKSNNPKGRVSKKIVDIGKVIKRYRGRCLFPASGGADLCTEPPSRCHVIPESSVLSRLKDQESGKVLEFDWDLGKWSHLLLSSDAESPVDLDNPATFEPRDLGTGDACTGLFACQCHDGVFNPSLDTDAPDFGNPHVRMLAAGRAVLYATDLASRRKFLVDKFDSQTLRSPNKGLISRWKTERKQAFETYGLAHSAAERWRNIWRSADRKADLPDLVDWYVLTFRSTLTFAACVFYGQDSVVMVLPGDEEHHKMTFLYFRENCGRVKEDIERLVQKARHTEKADAYGVSMIDELMSRGNGAFAASPASYKALGDEDRLTIQRITMAKLRFWGDFADS